MKLKKSISVLLSVLLLFSVLSVPAAIAGDEFTTVETAGAYLRGRIKAHDESIVFDYSVDVRGLTIEEMVQKISEIADLVLEEAFRHTGVPDEGDYLRSHHESVTISPAIAVSGESCSATLTYEFEYRSTVAREKETTEKIDRVLQEIINDKMNAYQKVTAIHDYIIDHVTYDHEHVADETYLPQYTACAALLDGTAVCQGYATLMYRMLLAVGIDCRFVSGYANGGAHGWNIVKLGDYYYNVDATFDDGDGMDRYECFLKCQEHFKDHVRDDEFLTDEFMREYPMAPSDYSGDGSELPEIPVTTEAPTTEAPTTEAPTTEAPTTEAPTTEAPTTETPTTEAPTTEAPTTEAPTTEAPTTEVPTTEAPTTEAPTTEAPTTEAPTTEAPTTEAPTTEPPVVRPDIELYYGDADLDGKVKASDARKILRHAARIEFIEEALALAAADLDRNGKVNAKDARAALRVAGRIDEKQPFDEQATPFEPEKPTEEPTEPAAPPTKTDRRIHIPAGGTYILTMSANEIRDPAIDDDGQGSFVVIDAPGEITGTHYIMISPIDPVGEKELAIYEYGNENDKPYTTITIDTDSGEPVFARSDGIPDIGAIYAVTPTYFSAAEQTDGPTVFSFLYAIEYDYFMHSSIDDILTRCDEELEANGYYFLGVETDEYGVAYSCYQNANGSFMDYALVRDEEFGTMLLIEYFEYGE